jgi:hypothetical protein
VVIKHREVIGGGGFFETQVEVVEKEEVIEVDDEGGTEDERKDERIFGFSNFNDFRQQYFTGREVDPLNGQSRINNIKQARAKYSKRYTN